MEMSKSPSNSIPFKSKKPILSSTPKKPTSVASITTPDRANPAPRLRNRSFALSISDVRRKAMQIRDRENVGSDPVVVVSEVEKVKRSKKKSEVVLLEKYELLCNFFVAMVNSTRLLRLKKLLPTLTKLCRNIESLTDRRFTLHHLAQLKHVLPEVILVKKIRVQDEETNCMKEDILVSLDLEGIVQDGKITQGAVGLSQLKGIFRSRMIEFASSHPEGDDVPEGELPQLFYTKKDPEPSVSSVAVSHIAPSFKRKFSSRFSDTSVSELSSAESLPCLMETPIKDSTSTSSKVENESSQGTPVELALTPSRFMASTPSICPPKRSLMSPDHDTNKSAKRRSLNFDENRGDIDVEGCSASKDVLNVLPKDLLYSLMEKERRMLEDQDPDVVHARKRQKLMAGVPQLFDMICLLFQSIKRSVITKEELLHKMVAGHLEIVDRREIEDQLKLLQEVAPEYISEQSSISGDILFRLNKSSSPELIRAKLLTAE